MHILFYVYDSMVVFFVFFFILIMNGSWVYCFNYKRDEYDDAICFDFRFHFW